MSLTLRDRFSLAWKAMTSQFTPEIGQAAYNLLNSVTLSTRGSAPDRSTQALLETFQTSPWVMACASRVADAVAATEWKLYVARDKASREVRSDIAHIKRATGKERRRYIKTLTANNEMEEVTDHIFLDAISIGSIAQTQSYLTGRTTRWIDSLMHDLVGDSFLIKQRNSQGAPVSFWPVPPHWVMETPTPASPFFRVSRGPWQKMIPAQDVFWSQNPNPANPYGRGVGIAKGLDDDLSIDEYAAKHMAAFFKNSARPDLLIMPKEGEFSNADRDRFEQWWNSKLQGVWRSFKPMFLNTPVEVKPLEQNFRNLQLKDIRQHERDTIMQVWGIPPELFGVVSSSNRSTIELAPYIFATYCMVPRLERARDAWQYRLLPEYDDNLIIDYVSPVPEDREFKLKTMVAQPGAFYANEFRCLAGLPEEDELDDVLMAPQAPPAMPTPDGQDQADVSELDMQGKLTESERTELDRLLLKAARR
jgi:hypothetical protein